MRKFRLGRRGIDTGDEASVFRTDAKGGRQAPAHHRSKLTPGTIAETARILPFWWRAARALPEIDTGGPAWTYAITYALLAETGF